MAHSIGRSIREMVRQYREELSCQTASNDAPLRFDVSSARKFLKSEEVDCEKRASSSYEDHNAGTKSSKDERHVRWHISLTDSTSNVIKEKTGTCTPLRSGTDDFGNFQGLDHRATEVLRRSQQIIERGQACKSSVAHFNKPGHHIDYIQAPSYIVGNGHSSPHNSKTGEIGSHKNHCRARDVVARNFEEIDQILGESNLIMEPSSSNDIQLKASDYIKVGKEIQQACRESGYELGQNPYGASAEHSKQDMKAREEAAIKAANYYLNKGNGHSNVRSARLLKNPLARTEAKLASTCRLTECSRRTTDQACYPSTLNTNKQQEWQSTMVIPYTTVESCQGMKVCDKSVPTTSSGTPIIHSVIKWPEIAEGDMQLSNDSTQLDSETVDLASMVESKGSRKYVEETNFSEGHLSSPKSVELDGGSPTSSRNSTTVRQRPSTVDPVQYPFSTKEKLMKKSLKIRDVCSIQMPASRATCFAQESGDQETDVPVSDSRSCTRRLTRGTSHRPLCLEDGMRQLSTEDLLLALENPRKTRASLKPLSSKNQFDASCEGQRTYQPEEYLSPGKCSTSLTATEFDSSFAGGLNGKDEELTTYSAILASLEQDYEEAFDRTRPQTPGSHRYLLKSNPIQRSKVRHSGPAAQLLSSSAKCRGTKDKDIKSPAWMHSLNVRKPTKWRAMSITHSRLQASAACLIKGTVVVGELEELALQHSRPKHTILAAAVDSNFKGRCRVDFDCRETTASIPNKDSVIDYSRQDGNQIPAPVYTKIIKTGKADDEQTSRVFSARVSKWFENGGAEIADTTTSSEQAGIQVEPPFAHYSDSYLNQWIHGSDGLAYHGISLPRVLTVQENHCVTNSLIAKDTQGFDNLPRNPTFSSGLDYLISEVVHEWVEICSASSPAFPACDGSQDLPTMSPNSTCSITEEVSTSRPVSEDGSPSPDKKLEIVTEMQVSEAGKWSENQDHLRKEQGSISLPRDSDLVKDVRKTSVAALAYVVQPLLAALQEAQIEEGIVTEFEADETVRLLLEKLQFYETKIRALKNRRKIQNLSPADNSIRESKS